VCSPRPTRTWAGPRGLCTDTDGRHPTHHRGTVGPASACDDRTGVPQCLRAPGGDHPFRAIDRRTRESRDAGIVRALPGPPGSCAGQARGTGATDRVDRFLPAEVEGLDWHGSDACERAWRTRARRHESPDGAPWRRTEDGERRARPRAGRPRLSGRSPRPASGGPSRHRARRRSREGRGPALCRTASGHLDAGIRHAHPARPADLPTKTALQRLRRSSHVSVRPQRLTRGHEAAYPS